MRLLILRNLGRDWPPLAEGQIVEVEEELGRRLLRESLAELAPAAADEGGEPARPAAPPRPRKGDKHGP